MNIIDENIGKKFGLLTIGKRIKNYNRDNRYYHCTCDCGKKVKKGYTTLFNAIRNNAKSSCGCIPSIELNIIDKHIGKKISNLKVVKRIDGYNKNNKKYVCKCNCGNNVIKIYNVLYHSLKYGSKCSCGCIGKGEWNVGRLDDSKIKTKIGEKHNNLKIIGYERDDKKRKYFVICECDCGAKTKNIYSELMSGRVKSCGCWIKEKMSILGTEVGMNNAKNHSKYNWHYIKGGDIIKMRSSYEVMFANILHKEGVEWQYEPHTFKLKNGKRYTPDFYLPEFDSWVEVKGWFNSVSKEKIRLFKEKGYNIRVVFKKELEKRLCMSNKKFIKEWKSKYNID